MKTSEVRKILILAEHFAPAYKAGGIVRCLENLVVILGNRYEFFVLTSNSNLNKNELLKGVVYDAWVSFTAESKILYASSKKQNFKTIKQALATIHPDVIYINGLYSVFFTLIPLWLSKKIKPKPTIVLAPWGMLHNGSLSIKPIKKKIYFRLFKLMGFSKNIQWHATNEQEKHDILRMFGKNASVTIANALPDNTPVPFHPIVKTESALRLITVSLVTPNKGHRRVIKALKELQDEIQAEYHIYGPLKDAAFWQTCLEEIGSLTNSIKVIYHGFINPSDLLQALQQSHVFILHSDGENFCQAIYEALAAGRPVITSDQTPWNELQEAKAGWNVKLHDFACLKDTIKEAYFMNQGQYNELCFGAQEKAKDFVSELNIEKQYDTLFQQYL